MAIFLQNGIKYNIINIGKEQESITVRIWAGQDDITVINYYNPCKRINRDILSNIGGQIQGKIIWCGDFNSHSTLWGSRYTDVNGSNIEEFLD